jgi:hypothetical protein
MVPGRRPLTLYSDAVADEAATVTRCGPGPRS